MEGILTFVHNYGECDIPDTAKEDWCCGIKNLVKDIRGDNQHHSGKTTSLYRNQNMQIIIYAFVNADAEQMISRLRNIEGTWRLYQRLPKIVDALEESPSQPHLLVSVGMTPLADRVEDFNKWYTDEHIPLLSRVPGWLYSDRYTVVSFSPNDPSTPPPEYVAIHGWASRKSFDSNMYGQAVSTTWRMSVVNQGVTKYERFDADFVQFLG